MAETTATPPAATPAPASPAPADAAAASGAAQPTPTPEQPRAPQNRVEAKRQAQQRASTMFADAAKAKETEEEETPGTETTETPETSTAEGQPKPSEPPKDGEAPETPEAKPTDGEPAKPEKPAGVAVEVDAQHPLAQQGLKSITVGSEQEARAVRGLLNSHVRRREIEETGRRYEGKISELQQKIARLESGQVARDKFQQLPEYTQAAAEFRKLEQLEADGEVAKGTAQQYWAGVWQKAQALEDQEYQDRIKAFDVERQEDFKHRAAENERRWRTDAYQRLGYLPDEIRELPEMRSWFDQSVDAFNREIQAGIYDSYATKYPDPDDRATAFHEAFAEFFRTRLVGKPEVRTAWQRAEQRKAAQPQPPSAPKAEIDQRSREDIERQAVERFKQELAEKRQKAPPHPLGTMASASSPTPAPPSGSDAEALANRSVHDIRKGARQQAGRRAEQYFSG